MSISKITETDQLSGAPHPRERHVLYGHEAAERAFLDGFQTGRLHHAWLIGGLQGIGKATLAYRIARYVLAHGHARESAPDALGIPAEHPVARAWSPSCLIPISSSCAVSRRLRRRRRQPQSRLIRCARPCTCFQQPQPLPDTESVSSIAPRISPDRAPTRSSRWSRSRHPRSLFLIIAHEPRRVLPTIRSRCRRLDLQPLAPDALARVLTSLDGVDEEDPEAIASAIARAEGSARRAFELLDPAKRDVVETMERLLGNLPREDLQETLALAEKLAKKGAEESFSLALETMQRWASAKAARTCCGRAHGGLRRWSRYVTRSTRGAGGGYLQSRPTPARAHHVRRSRRRRQGA